MTDTTILTIDDERVTVSVSTLTDDEGTECAVLDFAATYEVLSTWERHSPAHRTFGSTGDVDGDLPETTYVVWIADDELRVEHLETFFDGVAALNSYELDQFTTIDGIKVTAPPQS